MLVGNGVGQSKSQVNYFFVRKLGLGKEVVSLSISGRWNEMIKTG